MELIYTWILLENLLLKQLLPPKKGVNWLSAAAKASGQEEYFVDAVEVVSFGHSLFLSLSGKAKSISSACEDYEILEVREARMVLKNVGVRKVDQDRRRPRVAPKLPKEVLHERPEPLAPPAEEVPALAGEEASLLRRRMDKKRGRRHYRRRRGREELLPKKARLSESSALPEEGEAHPPLEEAKGEQAALPTEALEATTSIVLSSILPPPPTLISETIARYKDNAMFKGAFFVREEKQEEQQEGQQEGQQEQPQQEFPKEAWISDEAEEEIFRHRATALPPESSPETSTDPHEPADAKENTIPNGN